MGHASTSTPCDVCGFYTEPRRVDDAKEREHNGKQHHERVDDVARRRPDQVVALVDVQELLPHVPERAREEAEGHEFVETHEPDADISSGRLGVHVEPVGVVLRLATEGVEAGDARGQRDDIDVYLRT